MMEAFQFTTDPDEAPLPLSAPDDMPEVDEFLDREADRFFDLMENTSHE